MYVLVYGISYRSHVKIRININFSMINKKITRFIYFDDRIRYSNIFEIYSFLFHLQIIIIEVQWKFARIQSRSPAEDRKNYHENYYID